MTNFIPRSNDRIHGPVEHRRPQPQGVPFEQKTLAETVLESVRQIPPEQLRPVVPGTAGIGMQPTTLLAVLTYCYAREIYGSHDIELCMCEDAQFRRLCQNEFPRWPALRKFRRYNRDALQRCLEQTLSAQTLPTANTAQISAEAAGRIQIACWIDAEGTGDE